MLITRSWTELEVNGLGPALAMLRDARDQAATIDDRLLVALSHIQEGVIQVRGGDWAASLAALEGVGDDERALNPSQQCALLINRGMAHLGLGHSADAESDLTGAADLAAAHGLADQEFKARHNLACLAFVDGDLARALVLMRAADRMDAAVSRDRARLDHAEVLLEAGLVDKARSVLQEALESARADGHRLEVGEVSARLARCDLLVNDLDGARRHIRVALAAYRTRQVDELVRDASLIQSSIDIAAGHDLGAVIADLARRNDTVETGAVGDRAAVRLEAEARLLDGDVDGAERRLATLERTNRDSLAARLHETLVRARLDHARGRQVEAERRITTGNRLLAAHQFQSSSLDVRAALALHGRRLAAFDVERALHGQDSDGILTSIERWRAISHRINPVTTSTDPELTTMTRELRRLRRVAAEREGHASAELVAEVARLEDQVAQREWTLTVGGTSEGSRATRRRRRGAGGLARPVGHGGGVLRGRRRAVDHRARRRQPRGGAHRDAVPGPRADRPVAPRPAGSRDGGGGLADGRRPAARGRVLPRRRRHDAEPGGDGAGLLARPAGRRHPVECSGRGAVEPAAQPARPPGDRCPVTHPVGARAATPLRRRVGRPRSPRCTARGWPAPGPRSGRSARSGRPNRCPTEIAPSTSDEVVRALGTARVVHLAAHGVHEAQSPLFSSVQMADGPRVRARVPQTRCGRARLAGGLRRRAVLDPAR